jgi:poly-gamma-glutamate capsule biosynthesis protein CapA/YwtB (metallophosphatase superfamily)
MKAGKTSRMQPPAAVLARRAGAGLIVALMALAIWACSERIGKKEAMATAASPAAAPLPAAAAEAPAAGGDWFDREADADPVVRVAAAGDVMLQQPITRSVRQRSKGEENNDGYNELFPGLAAALSGADAAVANIEFPVFEKLQPQREMVFNGTTPVLKALKDSGFTVLTGANNHSYDHGPVSPASTWRQCQAAGIPCVGVGENTEEAEQPYIVEVKGMRLAFIGYTMLMNSNFNRNNPKAPHVNGKDWKGLLKQVKAAAAAADGVVVMIHWGQEYRTTPLKWQYGQAKELVEAGACLVIGHHPHVLERVQEITAKDGRRALVAFSLGNFTSNQGRGSPAELTRLGAILVAGLEKTERGVEVVSWQCLPTWVENREVEFAGKPVRDVHVEVVPVKIAELEGELETAEDDAARAALDKRIRFYEGRERAAEKILVSPKSVPASGTASVTAR